jgi:hypothetical protein
MLPREQEVTIENGQDEAARTDNIAAHWEWILVQVEVGQRARKMLPGSRR